MGTAIHETQHRWKRWEWQKPKTNNYTKKQNSGETWRRNHCGGDWEMTTLTNGSDIHQHLYLIEGVNQVGNVFTDTLKLRGEKKQFRRSTEGTTWSRQMNEFVFRFCEGSNFLLRKHHFMFSETILWIRHLHSNYKWKWNSAEWITKVYFQALNNQFNLKDSESIYITMIQYSCLKALDNLRS